VSILSTSVVEGDIVDLELGYCYNSRDNLLNTTLKGLITCTDLGSLSFCYSVGD